MIYSCFLGEFKIKDLKMKAMLDCYFTKQPIDASILLDEFSGRERTVYEGLIKIPFGSIISYSEFANFTRLSGVRNVASIIGKNPFPIVIPCHRVVRKSGDIGEYSFLEGRETKQLLLDYEKLYRI